MKQLRTFPMLLAALIAVLAAGAAAEANELVDAAAHGETDVARALLREGADVNAAQGDGMTALHFAADNGDQMLANLLIYAGANVEAGTRIGHYTPLHIASRNGHAGVIRTLLAAKADVDARTTNSGVQPIHLAAASGSTDAVQALLGAGADPDTVEGAWGQTPLIFAASANRVAVIEALLDAGADPAVNSLVVDTAEMEEADKAAEKRLAGFLAEFKAKQGGGANWKPEPSQVQAAIAASREIQRKWPDVPDPTCDALEQAADSEGGEGQEHGREECAKAVTYNADGEPVYDQPAANDEEPRPASYGELVHAWGGLAPLHHAVRQGHVEATMTLLDRGADIDQPTAGDHTSALLMAAINGQFDLALALLERGADPRLASTAGTTPLFAVLERQWAPRASYAHPVEHQQQQATHLEVMQALLAAGADPNVRLTSRLWYMEYTFDVLGQAGVHYAGATPFWRAAHALDVDAMAMLKAHGADTAVPTLKLPSRPRPQAAPETGKEGGKAGGTAAGPTGLAEAQKILEEAEYAKDKDLEEEDESGLPPVPVGGPFIYPIHIAAGAGYGQQFAGNAHRYVPGNWLPAVRFLVEDCGADVNRRDANGYTALHHAASRGDNELVEYLIGKGADVMVISRKGETTVDMANGPIQRLSPFPGTIALLESYGAINNHNCVSC